MLRTIFTFLIYLTYKFLINTWVVCVHISLGHCNDRRMYVSASNSCPEVFTLVSEKPGYFKLFQEMSGNPVQVELDFNIKHTTALTFIVKETVDPQYSLSLYGKLFTSS